MLTTLNRMDRRAWPTGFTVLALLAGGCMDPPATTTPPVPTASAAPDDVAVAPIDRTQVVAAGPRYDCLGVVITAADLEGPAAAERADTPAAEALRREIATFGLPPSGWREIDQSSQQSVFLYFDDQDPARNVARAFHAPATPGPPWSRTGERSRCGPRIVTPDGLPAAWRLTNTATLSATSRVLELVLTDEFCNGGAPVGPRLVEPRVGYGDDMITLLLLVRPATAPHLPHGGRGDVGCQPSPPHSLTLQLDEPLRDRGVADISFAPRRVDWPGVNLDSE